MTPKLIGQCRLRDWVCDVFLSAYQSDPHVPALMLKDMMTGEPITTATVNLAEYAEWPSKGCVVIKHQDDDGAAADALMQAGIIGPVMATITYGPFNSKATEHRLLIK